MEPQRGHIEADVYMLQNTIQYMETERDGLLETMERKHKLRIGATEQSQETIFQDMLALDSMISEIEKELREAGKELRRVTLELNGTEARGPPLELASTGRRHLETKAPNVNRARLGSKAP